jgi:hypothetical protein
MVRDKSSLSGRNRTGELSDRDGAAREWRAKPSGACRGVLSRVAFFRIEHRLVVPVRCATRLGPDGAVCTAMLSRLLLASSAE